MPKLVAAFGVRYDSDMLPGLIRNLDFVDDFAILYDFNREELWINEHEYRIKLRQIAIDKGADWILVTSPDERFEKGAGQKIRDVINCMDPTMFQFDLREMYTPDQYRIDGIWGKKKRIRLYPVHDGQKYNNNPIQCHCFPINDTGFPLYPVKDLGLNIYHLKMIEAENRKERTRVFKELDPDNKYQKIGYDYLDDENGIMLESIPKGREYEPKYQKYIFKTT